MGQRASNTATITFNETEVPAGNLIGEENKGFKLAMMTLDRTRPGVAAMATGIARAAFEFATNYSKERVQFGVPIAMHQAIQFMIADMATKVHLSRLATWNSAVLLDQGARNTLESSHAKRFAADTAMEVTTDAVQVYGGYGFIKDYPVEKLMRDAKIMQLYEGTSQIQRLVIARETLLPRRIEEPAPPRRCSRFRTRAAWAAPPRAAAGTRRARCRAPRAPRRWRRRPLHVEQPLAARRAQPLDQRRERHLGGVGAHVELRLGREQAADLDAVEPAGERAVAVPDLDRVRPAERVQPLVGGADRRRDPAAGPARVRAAGDHRAERRVGRDREAAGRAPQRARRAELAERHDPARVGAEPRHLAHAAERHREDSGAVGRQQRARLEVGAEREQPARCASGGGRPRRSAAAPSACAAP